MQTRWEYRTLGGGLGGGGFLVAALNELGEQGWEVVGVLSDLAISGGEGEGRIPPSHVNAEGRISIKGVSSKTTHSLLLKRPKEEGRS